MNMRIITDTEWNRLVDLTGGNNAKMHWEKMFSWVNDSKNRYNMMALYRAVRGYYPARYWSSSTATNRDVAVGFRPAIEGLDPDILTSDIKDGDSMVIGTLYMGGTPVKIPTNPTYGGDIQAYIPGTHLRMEAPLDDPAYQVTGIRDGDKVYVDRTLLNMISYEDIEPAITPEDQILFHRLIKAQQAIRQAQEQSQDIVAELVNLGYKEEEIEKRLVSE